MKNMKSIATGLGLVVATLLLTAQMALAAPVTIPAGLNPGDSYRLAFVTSTTTDALSSDISFYNNFVNTLGLAATGIDGWTAIASTEAVDARDNTNSNINTDGIGTAIFLLDGTTKIADNYAQFWEGGFFPARTVNINVTEDGTRLNNGLVWTGSASTGIVSTDLGLGSSQGIGQSGDIQDENCCSFWVTSSLTTLDNTLHLYALSDIIIVQGIPEPAALTLFALGLAGLGLAHRKARR